MMTEQDFLSEMQDLMDTEMKLTMDTQLKDIEEWDSLSHVSFIAFSVTHGNHRVTPQEIKAAQVVRDLYDLVRQ